MNGILVQQNTGVYKIKSATTKLMGYEGFVIYIGSEGRIVSATDTAEYVTMYHGDIYPFWGDWNSDVLATYVDLDEISDELAWLLEYTKANTAN